MEPPTELQEFLALYRSKHSRKHRLWALSKFFHHVYRLPQEPSRRFPLEERISILTTLSHRYLQEARDGTRKSEADVKAIFIATKDELSPQSMKNLLSGVKVFLEEYGVVFPPRFFRRLLQRHGGGKQTMDRIPTDEELRSILEHLPLHGRAFFHLLATSGLRIGTALQLELDDIELQGDITIIKVRGKLAKSGAPLITFASSETTRILHEWLATSARKDYINEAVNQSRYKRKEMDTRVFPWSRGLATNLWLKALQQVGLDERDSTTGWLVLHIHMLRARVSTKLSNAGIQQDYIHALLGQRGYLPSYKKFRDDELEYQYRKGMPDLLISKHSKEIKRVEKRLEVENQELRDQVNAVSTVITKLSTENETLKEDLIELRTLYNFEAKMQTGQHPDDVDPERDFGDDSSSK